MAPPRGAARSPAHHDDDIDPALIDQIPDVAATYDPQIATPEVLPPSEELAQLLYALSTEMQQRLVDEVERMRESVGTLFADMEQRLVSATASIETLQEENAQLLHARDRYERAFQTLKELTRDIENPDR